MNEIRTSCSWRNETSLFVVSEEADYAIELLFEHFFDGYPSALFGVVTHSMYIHVLFTFCHPQMACS